MSEWRYDIKYGPEGEANYAWVYRGNDMVATMKTYHAHEICKQMNFAAGLSPSQAPATGKADTGLPVNSPKE